jgi:hypothetical protein
MTCLHAAIVAVENQQILHVLIVFVALSIQHAMRMRHIVICGLLGSAVFFHIVSLTALFSKKKRICIGHKMCGLIFSTTFV